MLREKGAKEDGWKPCVCLCDVLNSSLRLCSCLFIGGSIYCEMRLSRLTSRFCRLCVVTSRRLKRRDTTELLGECSLTICFHDLYAVCLNDVIGEEVQAVLKTDWASDGKDMDRSGHSVGGGLNRSGHGMNRSGHGRSLGFKASRGSSLTSGSDLGMANKRHGARKRSQWAEVLTPTVLADNAPTK